MPGTVNNTSSTVPNPYSYKNKKEFSTELDQNAFMKLMLEQIKHQDPLSPMDNQQFIQQTSLMTMVEKLTRMTQLLEESNSSLLNLHEYEGLIGKTAKYEKISEDEVTGDKTFEEKTGMISAVKMVNKKIYLTIGDDEVTYDKVKDVESKDFTNDPVDNTLKYAGMVGRNITYLAKEHGTDGSYSTVEKTSTISSLSMKNGLIEFLLANGSKIKPTEIIGVEFTP